MRLIPILCCCALAAPSWGAAVTYTFDRNLRYTDMDRDGQVDDLPVWNLDFTLTAPTSLEFDLRAAEYQDYNNAQQLIGSQVDLNGDGRISGFDGQLRLFNAGNTQVAENDDYTGALNQDGSISRLDSAMAVTLNPGDYSLSLGVWDFSIAQALSGVQLNRAGTLNRLYGTGPDAPFRLTLRSPTATVTGVTFNPAVPEPGTIALLVLGGGAVMWWSRRRQLTC